jgi:hypothetical protein
MFELWKAREHGAPDDTPMMLVESDPRGRWDGDAS